MFILPNLFKKIKARESILTHAVMPAQQKQNQIQILQERRLQTKLLQKIHTKSSTKPTNYKRNYSPRQSGICSKYTRLFQHANFINLTYYICKLKEKKSYNHVHGYRKAIWKIQYPFMIKFSQMFQLRNIIKITWSVLFKTVQVIKNKEVWNIMNKHKVVFWNRKKNIKQN